MPDLPLTLGCGLYDWMIPLHSGEVKPTRIALTFVPEDNPRDVFEGTLDGRFQASEMSSSDFLRRKSAGECPFVGIPAFPSRVFRHGRSSCATMPGSPHLKTSKASASAFLTTR